MVSPVVRFDCTIVRVRLGAQTLVIPSSQFKACVRACVGGGYIVLVCCNSNKWRGGGNNNHDSRLSSAWPRALPQPRPCTRSSTRKGADRSCGCFEYEDDDHLKSYRVLEVRPPPARPERLQKKKGEEKINIVAACQSSAMLSRVRVPARTRASLQSGGRVPEPQPFHFIL